MSEASLLFLLCAVAAAGCAGLLFCVRPDRERLSAALERLPRAKTAGWILSAVAVVWCVPNVRAVLDAGSPFQPWVVPGSFLLLILCCVYLDFLFARAFAALLILAAHGLLKELQPVFPTGYPAFAALILFAGLAGIVLAAKPHWLRDWFRLVRNKPVARWCFVAYFGALAVVSLVCLAGTFRP